LSANNHKEIECGNVWFQRALNLTKCQWVLSNVNQLQISLKTVAGNYVVKLDRSTPTPYHIASSTINDEATVTDATSAAHLQVVVHWLSVWYNGTAWTKLGGGSGGSVSTLQAKQLISTTVHLLAVVYLINLT
jgi:predicted anti-sigma-YlaC factor YlaD